MTDMTEIKGLVEAINPVLVQLRGEVDAMKARDGLDEQKLAKMADEVTKKMETLQAEQTKLRAALARPENAADTSAEVKALESDGRKKLDLLFRKGVGGMLEIKAMSSGSNPDGGYLIMPELSSTVVSRIFETSNLRQVANVEQTASSSREFLVDDDQGTAQWLGETSAATEDTPQIGRKTIAVFDLGSQMRATNNMLSDAYLNVEAWMRTKGADQLARAENTAFVSGNGVAKPRGFTTYAAWASAGVYERDKIEQINSGSASTITGDGLLALQWSLKEQYQARAVFGMKRATYGVALTLKGADQYFFGPLLLKDGQAQMQLLGKPVYFWDDMTALGSGALSVAYGDFSAGYTILDRSDLIVLRDPATAFPYTIFHMNRRTGGDVTNFDAIKLGKCSS
jgi:HK97 family phage major capsid protein